MGIPHPPGTLLYVALGRGWIVASGWLLGAARAMNVLSAVATAAAGALTTWMIAREARSTRGAGGAWGAVASGLVAGWMCSAWANATESEVYAVALLHVVAMLACALRAADAGDDERWLALTAYLMALAPALHLSALVGAPAAIAVAARRADGRWSGHRLLMLGGTLVAAAGIGRMSTALVVVGALLIVIGTTRAPQPVRASLTLLPLVALATSALLIMLVRARHDPLLNQGDPSTWSALADVVARRQYPVGGLWPRRAPVWLQLANIVQYADWQVAMGWGRGIFTTVPRVLAAVLYLVLGTLGWRAMRHDAPRLARLLVVLAVCGSLGVAVYLNLQPGNSIGWGLLPEGTPHEARERDYFFVLAFWAWGCFAGWGALALARRVRRPPLALVAALVPLAGNWFVVDRSSEPAASAPRRFAHALLADAPPNAVLFTSGDNDSYPLWYLQQVEGMRPDVQVVALPLLPAQWYTQEVTDRAKLPPLQVMQVPGARWQHEEIAAAVARAARDVGRPVAASPAITARERVLLGSQWTLGQALFVAGRPPTGLEEAPVVSPAAAEAMGRRLVQGSPPRLLPDDVTAPMLRLLECPRLGGPWDAARGSRDSLEVKCNFR